MRTMRGAATLLIAMHLLLGAELHAQTEGTDEAEGQWLTSVHYLRYRIASQSDWRATSVLGGRVTPTRTFLLEAERSERAGLKELTVGTDLYQTLTSRAYVNVRARISPGAETVPRLLAAVELTHSLGRPWETSIGYEHRRYALDAVQTMTIGPARYIGPWYVRLRPAASLARGEATLLGKAFARRFFKDSPANYVEFAAGYGQEFVEMLPTASRRVETRAEETWLLSGRAQLYLTPTVGITFGAVYQSYYFLGVRPAFNAGVLGRF